MGKLLNEWIKETLLTEDIKQKVVVYAGRFQPFHKGHYASYQQLVKQFGKDNVYIGTSDKTDTIKSPFNFKEKKLIMTKMFGISPNKIVQIKNPYAPKEILDKFPKETTAFITVVGEKDRYRLKGKYFQPYHPDKIERGYSEVGYVYVTTAQGPAGGMSGTEARELLLKGSDADKVVGFKKVYDGKFDSKIYKLITTKLAKVFGKLEQFVSTVDLNQIIIEAGIYNADAGEPETGYLPGGYTRMLGTNSGKPEPWFAAGGYEQMHFPIADYIYSKDSKGTSDATAFSVVKRVETNKDLDVPVKTTDYVKSDDGTDLKDINEASSLAPLGKSMVDDGPGFTYGNSKSYRKVGDDVAEALGWQVVDYILGNDDESIYADSLRTLDDKYPVSYFPSGHEGIDAQSQRYNIMKSSDAYKAWSKKIKGVATAVGYQLIDFLDAEDSKTNNPNEPTKETTPNFTVDSKTERLSEDAGPKWQRSTFELMQKRHVPLSPSIVNKMLGDITVEVYHTTDNNGLDKLMKLQGKKKSISAFDASDARGPAGGYGMWTKGGIVAKIEGTLLARSIADLWSKPDKQGRRWISTVNGFGRPPFDFGLPEIEKPKEEYTPQELRQLTKDYIDTAYKQMYKHRDEFRRRSIESANKLNASDGWNEAVVNNIKITALYVNKQAYTRGQISYLKKKYNVPVIAAANANDIVSKLRDNGVHIRDNVNINRNDILTEGGAYGHMNHPFDVEMNLTFGDLKAIIKGALTGNLEFAREKTDGQALAISWRDDRGLIAARNKGHLKNRGENALNIKGMADKFAGRGGLTDAYNFAMKDLEKAIKGLTSKQRDKIFQNGGSFMNLEVIYPTSVNVIPYGQPLLVFHGTMQYNEDGIAIGENAEAGRMLAGMIKQVNAHVQDNYTISGPTVTELPKSVKLSSLQGKFTSQLSKLQGEFNLKDADGVAEYHQAWWEDWIKKNTPADLNDSELKGLTTRWAFFDKSFALNNKTISNPDVLSWAKKIDKQDHSKMAKDNLRRFEDIFLGVGAEVLSFMDSIITVSPDKATRDMKARLDQTIKDVKSSGDPKKIQKLKSELERLQAIGGSDKIVPNEGIVFTYKGNTYKLTGAFSSLNQLLGLMYF